MEWRRTLAEVNGLDVAVYAAIAQSETPSLDRGLRRLSSAANYSRISMICAAALAVAGGSSGRRAAVRGVGAVAATSAVVNIAIKPLTNRRRPDRQGASVVISRHVEMPRSDSFPSGHTAAAFAFAVGAGRELPWTAAPLTALASLVGYSRVHTGVHYPGDVAAGFLCGVVFAGVTNAAFDRLESSRA